MNRAPVEPSDPIYEQAGAWLARLNSGRVTHEQVDQFRQWKAQSAAHAKAWADTVQTWEQLQPALKKTFSDQATKPSVAYVAARSRRQQRRRLLLASATSASVGGLLFLRPPLGLWPSWSDWQADYRTTKGEQRTLTPRYGLTVQMNTSTTLNFIPGDHQQFTAVALLSGEAQVESLVPVHIRAAAGWVQLEQATVNVRVLNDGRVCVSCLQGRAVVRLQSHHSLPAGQQLVYDDAGLQLQQPVQQDHVSAWRDGILSFSDVPLHEVIEEINRYRPGRVVLRNSSLALEPVRMVVSIHKTGLAVDMLAELYDMNQTKLPGNIILLS